MACSGLEQAQSLECLAPAAMATVSGCASAELKVHRAITPVLIQIKQCNRTACHLRPK
jgi:hypothetical protein